MKPIVTAAAMALSLLDPASAAESELQFSRAGSRAIYEAPEQNFTGKVSVEMLQTPSGEERASAGSVSFSPGARTAWHSHPLGQTLIVTAGIGRIQRWGGPMEEIRVGDVVHIPPNVKHWHGAGPDSVMTHIAITEMLNGSAADWLEQVTEEQYRAKPYAVVNAASAPPSQGEKLFGDIAPKFAQLTDEVLFGDVWARPALSRRDRSLATVSALTAMYRPEQLKGHLALARQNGLSEAELVEVLTHIAFYAGWPNTVTAIGVARDVFSKSKP